MHLVTVHSGDRAVKSESSLCMIHNACLAYRTSAFLHKGLLSLAYHIFLVNLSKVRKLSGTLVQILKIIIVPQNKLFLFMLLLSADFFLKSTFFSKKKFFQ